MEDRAIKAKEPGVVADVFVADEQSAYPVDTARYAKLARDVLEAEGVKAGTEVSLLFVDETSMADLNARFLRKEGPTDVLAFPIDDEPDLSGRFPDEGGRGPSGQYPSEDDLPFLLGDVVVCPAVALRSAEARGVGVDEELSLLVVHGLLHLLGMDHEEDEEAALMERREEQLIERFARRRP